MKNNSIFVPDYIKKNRVNWKDFPILARKSEEDSSIRDFLDSMPGNYFSMFSPQEVISHYHFIARNSGEKFGDLPSEISIRIKNVDHIILICNRSLSAFIKLLESIRMSGRRIVHHHSYVPVRGNFQILFIQTIDEHIHPDIIDDINMEQVLSTEIKLTEKRLTEHHPGLPTADPIIFPYSALIQKNILGDSKEVLNTLDENFFKHLNIGFRRGVNRGNIAAMSIIYLQMLSKGIDSLCYVQKSHSGLYRISCFARSPEFMKSQKYLLFITKRLHYYQNLGRIPGERNFNYSGGYSTFIKCSPKEQIEASVFYIRLNDSPGSKEKKDIPIDLEEELSLDLSYKVVPRFNDLSLFDVMGPIMVGPSSSHTAGANRLGRLARNIITAALESGKLPGKLNIATHLHGSFASTGEGHGTLNAILGGIMGLGQSNEKIAGEETNPDKVSEFDINENKLKWQGFIPGKYLGSDYHENSVLFMVNDSDDFTKMPDCLLYIVGESYGGGNVQVREIGGRIMPKVQYFDTVRRDRFTGKNEESLPGVFGEIKIKPIFDYPPITQPMKTKNVRRPRVADLDDIAWYCERSGFSLPEIAMLYEMDTQNIYDMQIVMDQLRKTRGTIFEVVSAGIREKDSNLEFSGGNGYTLNRFASRKGQPGEKLFLKAAAYSISVAEQNAGHKKIIACPTAGSCGILPGVLVALEEIQDYSELEILDSLLVGAFIGLVISNTVPTAGATHGCQAETGIACAMAAAMAAFLFDGTTKEIVNAAVLALKNSLGLVCDPIAGKVEVPCIKRNGFKAVEALVAARMSIAGIISAVPPSEVVRAMDEIGRNLSYIYRETSAGGLARTIRGRDEPRCGKSCRICMD